MFLVSDTLRVGVVTGHIPLAKVSESITIAKIGAKLKLMDASLRNDFWIRKPKIAVLGLNPHASDNGLIGTEEQNVITPAIEEARNTIYGLLALMLQMAFLQTELICSLMLYSPCTTIKALFLLNK